MVVVLSGGGTAGHINPGLSIAAAIRRRHPGAVIRFAGNPDGMEARLVPKAGFDMKTSTPRWPWPRSFRRAAPRCISPARLRGSRRGSCPKRA